MRLKLYSNVYEEATFKESLVNRYMCIKFSIITVTYNSSKTVAQTIKSVLGQTYKSFEYILVDGASKDGTVDIIKHYAKMDSRIRFISEPDHGIYDAMNKGIKMATGDVIALLNSDDFYEPDALANIVENIPRKENFVVYGMVRFLKNEREDSVILNSHNSLPERMIMHPACFVSKSVYGKYQYDTAYKSAADYDLFLRLYYDNDIMFIPVYKIIANFRLGGMSGSVISHIEANNVRYKYGLISRTKRDISNLAIKVRRSLLGK